MWLGIDFGTSYSSASFVLGGELVSVEDPLREGSPLPSSVYLKPDGEIVVGQAAENLKRLDPRRFQDKFKRSLGEKEAFYLGDMSFLPEVLVAKVLAALKRTAEKAVNDRLFTRAVVTVPATYAKANRTLMHDAARAAGFEEVRILDEPVAAAVYYRTWVWRHRPLEPGATYLVYDLGGGTFDTALVRATEEGLDLRGHPGGEPRLGGMDFDREIRDDLLKRSGPAVREALAQPDWGAQEGDKALTQEELARLRRGLMLADDVREAKHHLSEHTECQIALDLFGGSGEYELARQDFNTKIEKHILRTVASCREMVKREGLSWDEVARVLLVGGSCQIPFIQETLMRELGRPIERAPKLGMVVSQGAALWGEGLDAAGGRLVATSVPIPVSAPNPGQRIVSKASTEDAFRTIGDALRTAAPGVVILVRPGRYLESVVLDKPVALIADGSMGEVVVESQGAPCITIRTDMAVLKGLTVVRHADTSSGTGQAEAVAVHVSRGHVMVEACDVRSGAGSAILVEGPHTSPHLSRCRIHDSRSYGIWFRGESRGLIEDCVAQANDGADIAVEERADPAVRNCRIVDGSGVGILVASGGKGTFEQCEIAGKGGSGVEVRDGGDPVLDTCEIRDGRANGVTVHAHGAGRFTGCDIAGNQVQGVEISGGADPLLVDCTIHDSHGSGVWVHTQGKGRFQGGEITGNKYAGIDVGDGGNPELQEVRVHGGKSAGLVVRENGCTAATRCEFSGNGLSGIEIHGGNPTLTECTVSDNLMMGVFVHAKGNGTLVECNILGNTLANVEVRESSDPTLRSCRIQDGKANGVKVHAQGRGTFEICDIGGNAAIGVEISDGANPLLKDCRIHDMMGAGVRVFDHGRGRIEGGEVLGNAFAGVEVGDGGHPELIKVKVHGGKSVGVRVQANGGGSMKRCEIFGNAAAGIEIVGGNPMLTRCVIRDGQQVGVLVHAKGTGTLDECDVRANARANIESRDDGNPVVRGGKIRDGKASGVLVHRGGGGTFQGVKVQDNAGGGYLVDEGCHVRRVIPDEVYARLRVQLNLQSWQEADQESIRIILDISGHQKIDNKQKAYAIPDDVLRTIDRLWRRAGGGALIVRPWVAQSGAGVTSGSIVTLWDTWLNKRLKALGLTT